MAQATSTKNTQIFMSIADATPTPMTATAATKAAPAVLTFAAVTGVEIGDIVQLLVGATGLSSIDGKMFVIGAVDSTAKTIELLGSDSTGDPGTFAPGAGGVLRIDNADQVLMCFASITLNPDSPAVIQVGTFCNPSSTLPGTVVSAGTADFTGYVDITSPDYNEIQKAYADGVERYFEIMLPANGYLLFKGTVSMLNLDVPLDGAIGYNGQITLSEKPVHVFEGS